MSKTTVIQCPRCHEFIAADAKSCRFCSTPIDAGTAQAAAVAQEKENKQYRRKHYARHMLIGAGVFALGLIITIGSYQLAVGGYYFITYGPPLAGAGDLLYGVVGWIGELK
jgi:hypothetical protein